MSRKYLFLLFSLVFVSLIGCNGSLSADNNEDSSFDSKVDSLFRFIHISDTHGSTVTIDAVNDFCSKHRCDFVILTGDIVPNDRVIKSIRSSNIDYLVIPGNHDAYEKEGPGQFGFRSSFLNVIDMPVHFPEDNTNYWFKDYEKNGKVLRVIGLDQFEQNSYGNTPGLFAMMTQKQIDWFVSLLERSHDVDGILILIHMGFGNSVKGQRDTSNHNEFISELASSYSNSYDYYGPEDPFMIPEIVDAYVSGDNFYKVYNEGTQYELVVRTNFLTTSNNFIGYFGGHLHWDEVEYLKFFPKQLLCLMAFCGQGKGAKLNDLTKTDFDYNFNLIDVDVNSKTLKLVRYGASQTINKNRRRSISFPLR